VTPRLFVRPAAQADLDEAFTWYESRRAGLGSEFLRAVEVCFAAIERHPEQFAVVDQDIRRARVRHFPYLVFFVITDAEIVVLAVMHGRRHPRRWQRRR
jgi:plasmid stabilization system protein ParE